MKNADRKAETTSKLLFASLATLQELGYNKLRTSEVAKRSGMSEGILFRYFPTKYDLVRASLEQALMDSRDRLASELLSARPTDRRVMLEMVWRVLSQEKLRWTYELYGAAHTDPELRRVIQPVLAANSDMIDQVGTTIMVEVAGIRPQDARNALNVMIWSMQALTLRNMGRGETNYQDELIDTLVLLADQAYPAG